MLKTLFPKQTPAPKIERFIILGCQRSGTTVMRLALDSHPSVFCWDERNGYGAIEKDQDSELKTTTGDRPQRVGFKLPIYTELMIEYGFAERFPYKIIFMRRPLCEVAASMITLKNFLLTEYATIKKWLGDANRKQARLFFNETMMDEVKDLNNPMNAARLAAAYWAYKNYAYYQLLPTERVLGVQYHDLVLQPTETLKKVLDFLDLPWDNRCLQHHTIKHTETKKNIAIGNTRADRQIDTESLAKFSDILTVDQIAYLNEFEEKFYDEFERPHV